MTSSANQASVRSVPARRLGVSQSTRRSDPWILGRGRSLLSLAPDELETEGTRMEPHSPAWGLRRWRSGPSAAGRSERAPVEPQGPPRYFVTHPSELRTRTAKSPDPSPVGALPTFGLVRDEAPPGGTGTGLRLPAL